MRKALDGEIEKAELVTVELAHGQIQLHQDPTTGTLLWQQPVEPIVPVRGLVDLGYKMTRSRSGCTVERSRRGKIVSHLRDGCPVVPQKDALLLIHEIEAAEPRKYLDIEQGDNLDPEVMSWWERRCPEVPRFEHGGGARPDQGGVAVEPHDQEKVVEGEEGDPAPICW